MNMSLRGAAVAVLSLFTLVACDESRVVGTLTTTSTLRIVSPGGNKQTLSPGSYRTAIRAQEKGAQVFITASGKEVTFKIPQLAVQPGKAIRISAATLRQEFGLSGLVSDVRSPFDRVVSRYCVYGTERRLVCENDGRGGGRGPGRGDRDHGRDRDRDDRRGREECRWETVTIDGSRDVREVGYSTNRQISMEMLNTANQKVGQFRGSVSLGETITDQRDLSGCRPDYRRPY